MHFAISASWGPTDPTRAMLPFIFSASALQVQDKVTLMLFHDAAFLGFKGVAKGYHTFCPPQRFGSIINDKNAKILICKPCADARKFIKKTA